MEKPADNQYPIHELIKQRWSPLAFNIRPVEPEKIASLLEAARWAASCFNEQPWFFIVATQDNAQEYEKLFSCLVEANQTWAKDAPLLMLSVAKLSFTRNNKPNRHALHDLGFAVGNLTLQAQALGLFVHQMGGFMSCDFVGKQSANSFSELLRMFLEKNGASTLKIVEAVIKEEMFRKNSKKGNHPHHLTAYPILPPKLE